MKTLAICLLLGAVFLSGMDCKAQVVWDQFLLSITPKTEINNAAVPIYSSNHVLLAVAKVDRAFMGYERHGFFRIGTMPLVILQNVQFEVRDTARAADALENLHRWFQPQATRRLEMRHLCITCAPDVELDAGQARLLTNGVLELSKNVRLKTGNDEQKSSQAFLQVTGCLAGQIVICSTPASTNNILAVKPKNAKTTDNEKQISTTGGSIGFAVR